MVRKEQKRAFNFDEALHLMRKHNPELQETGFGMLQAHAPEYVDRLIAEFHAEPDYGTACWLLELIGDAKSPLAIPLFQTYLQHDNNSLHFWAVTGLKKLDTKETRRLLWEAGEEV